MTALASERVGASAAAALAHGIRNPLASIRAHLEVLRGQVDPLDERRPDLDRVLEEIDRIAGTVEAILDHGSVPEPQPAPCDLAKTLAEATQPLLAKAERRGLRVQREGLDREVPARTDSRLLGRSVRRILENAIDASEEGGTVEISCDRNPKFVEISITDHGAGIEPSEIERLGEPFHGGKSQGLGLGLHLSLRDLRLIGAKVDFRSRPGQGTTVAIRLSSTGGMP